MVFDEYNTVQTVANEDIILVGEEHHNHRSKELMDRVLDEVGPNTIAVEASPGERPVGGGMGLASNYASKESIPAIAIDSPNKREKFRSCSNNSGRLLTVANQFSHPIQENGDVDIRAINNARRTIRDEFGQQAYNEMYTNREIIMTKVLKSCLRDFESPIVAGVGTFHILALRDMFSEIDGLEALSEERIINTT